MYRKILLPLCTALFVIVGVGIMWAHRNNVQTHYISSQNNNQNMQPTNDIGYDTLWIQVEAMQSQGLPQSALKVVEKIYTKAVAEKNSPQITKVWVHRFKYLDAVQEKAFDSLVGLMEAEVGKTVFPANAVMHSLLGDLYWMYYQAHIWDFSSRSQTVNFSPTSLDTWDLTRLSDRVIYHYNQSLLQWEDLQMIPIESYDVMLTVGTYDRKLRPSLYDLLAHRAIEFFSNSQLTISRPADIFEMKEDFYFGDARDFANKNITTADTMSFHFYGVKILQRLLSMRLADTKNPEALIEAELRRFDFVFTHSINPEKNALYFDALQRLDKQFASNPYGSEISYRIAGHYAAEAAKYSYADSSTYKYRYSYNTALDICKKTVAKFPDAMGSKKCKALEANIMARAINFTVENVVPNGRTYAIAPSYRNIDTLYVMVGKIDYSDIQKLSQKYYGEELYEEYLKATKEMYRKTVVMPATNDHQLHNTEILLDKLGSGSYMIVVSNNPQLSVKSGHAAYDFTQASNISYTHRTIKDGSVEVFVTDRNTGVPLQGAKVQPWYQKYNYITGSYNRVEMSSVTTDKDGKVVIPSSKADDDNYYLYFNFSYNKDFLYGNDNAYFYKYQPSSTVSTVTRFFLDRAIYRPGQTLYFKGIVMEYENENMNMKIRSGYKETVILYDANWQKVASLDLTTNEYGTYSGSFTLPLGLMNGQMHIETPTGSQYFSVEEYKRPTFDVNLLPFKGDYMLDQDVTVEGKALTFAGANVTDAQVKWRVTRTPRWIGWWYRYIPSDPVEIANGTAKTDENGVFKFTFKAIPDRSMGTDAGLSFSYQITADVSDITGETRSTNCSVQVGYRTLTANIEVPSLLNRTTKDSIAISTINLNGQPVSAQGTIKVFRLKTPDKAMRDRSWNAPDQQLYSKDDWYKQYPGNVYNNEWNDNNLEQAEEVLNVKFNTASQRKTAFDNLAKWQLGRYVAYITTTDARNNAVESKTFFTVYDETGKDLPLAEKFWCVPIKTTGEPGEKAKFLVGSGYDNAQILFTIEHKGNVISSQWLKAGGTQQIIEVPITEAHRGNFTVHFTLTRDNRFYNQSYTVAVPYTNKQLDIEFSTFRNKLLPGQNEEWRVTVKGPKGDKVMAEMLAGMYDASLDEFAPNAWNFDIYQSYYSTISWNGGMFGFGYSSALGYNPYVDVPWFYYDAINWFGYSYYSYRYNYYSYGATEGAVYDDVQAESASVRVRGATTLKKDKNGDDDEVMEKEEEKTMPQMAQPTAVAETTASDTGKSQSDGQTSNKVRTNFNETAFFFPHLETDADGNVVIKFTIPESLTKWKFMGLAHTKNLEYGMLLGETVTQKDLMVVPNAPRFFREGDVFDFPVKVTNLSADNLSGMAKLEFFDALTMKPLTNIFADAYNDQSFTVAPAQNALVSWRIKIPQGVSAITFRATAKSGAFSDGEERPVPTLTNRMLVTESMPLPIRGGQTKTFNFANLTKASQSSTLRHHKLTLEFTSNPAWYAIQALPYMMEYPYECAEQIFTRFYANSLASSVANSSPKVKRVFDAWQQTPNQQALLSNLDKNEELKYLLLEETPWVMDANDETERKKRVGLLFDLNRMSNELEIALKKLDKMQTYNGGWPWFAGMPESDYITQYIVSGLGHLDHLNVSNIRQDSRVWNMTTDALRYVDNAINKEYEWLKRHYTKAEMEQNHLSYTAINYLYARSYFTDVPITSGCTDAFDYYYSQAQKFWLQQNKYMQGMLALGLNRWKDDATARAIVKSLSEHALHSDEMGMYWKENVAGYYWYEAPIEFQALMIEVYNEVAKDSKSVDDLKVWLLKQKQTQDWKTTKATAEACYALLKTGADWLDSDRLVDITMGGKKIDPTQMPDVKVEAGTGYFKTSWSGADITADMGNITVSKQDAGVAWGAVYWQYFEQLDKIKSAQTPLQMTKKLFRQKITASGPVIEPVDAKTPIMVGDKIIVRIELRVDRAMEYVHMKDMRASGFEPINVFTQYKWQDGLGYVESTKDAATNFFFDYLPKGTYVFEYPLRATLAGDFSNGITTIQCMYAPEFTSHSEGIRVNITK